MKIVCAWCYESDRVFRDGKRQDMGRRIVAVHGTDLFVGSQRDPELSAGKPGFVPTAFLNGVPLKWINEKQTGNEPDYGLSRVLRFAIPDDAIVGGFGCELTVVRNDSKVAGTNVDIPKLTPTTFPPAQYALPQVVSQLEGVTIDLRRYRGSQPALTVTDGFSLRRCTIIAPNVPLFGGTAKRGRIEHCQFFCESATDYSGVHNLHDSICVGNTFQGRTCGPKRDFGLLFSGQNNLIADNYIDSFDRGPVHWFRQTPMRGVLYLDNRFSSLGDSWNASEGILTENTESVIPSMITVEGSRVLVRIQTVEAKCQPRAGSFVACINAANEITSYSEIYTVERTGQDFTIRLKSDLPAHTGRYRIGPLHLENSYIRNRAFDVKHLLSFNGGSINNYIQGNYVEQAQEPACFSVALTHRETDYYDHAVIQNTHRFNGFRNCDRAAYIQTGDVYLPPQSARRWWVKDEKWQQWPGEAPKPAPEAA